MRIFSIGNLLRTLALLAPLLSSFQAHTQENLVNILNRGFVAHWLVCGPFAPDVEDGIAEALTRGEAPLGDTDYMESLGGIARLRPRHLQVVDIGGGESVVWQQAGTTGPKLDLSPMFEEGVEGVAYAAFSAAVGNNAPVYLDLQTPLGARIWHNGFPLRDIATAPVIKAGLDRFIVEFRPGNNLLVFEFPLVSTTTLARIANLSPGNMARRGYANRPDLRNSSGFEISLKVLYVQPLGDIYYVPRLIDALSFSGTTANIKQDALLTFFNPNADYTHPVTVNFTTPNALTPQIQRIDSIAPGAQWEERVSIPMGGTTPGQSLQVQFTVILDEATSAFQATVVAKPRSAGGRVYVVTGQQYQPDDAEDAAVRTTRQNRAFNRQSMLAVQEADYGFDLGTASQWQAALIAHPQWRAQTTNSVALNRSATQAGYATPDERLVGGTVLARNLAYGLTAGRAVLENTNAVYYAWNIPGVAPQTPQLLAQGQVAGMISNLEIAGLPALTQQLALDGTRRYHRRKATPPGPITLNDLRTMVALHRRELLAMNIASDVLVNQSATPPPEPFFVGAATNLRQTYPSIQVQSGGAHTLFLELDTLYRDARQNIPHTAIAMNTSQPGSIMAQPDLKRAHARTEETLLSAEKLATFSALLGADYPDRALHKAWRQLLYWSAPNILGLAETRNQYWDASAGYHEALELAHGVLREAGAYLAGEVDTVIGAPIDATDARALVVFNPSSWQRSDLCEITLPLQGAAGIRVLNDRGVEVPVMLDRQRRDDQQTILTARVQFFAEAVPAMGYRCYYPQSAPSMNETVQTDDYQIENDYFLLVANPDTGNITTLQDKRTGTELAKSSLNKIILRTEDAEKNDEGRELWTDGEIFESDSQPLKITTEITGLMQRLTIESNFAEGTLVRRLTLYQGIPRVHCEILLEGVTLDNRMLYASFNAPSATRATVVGERFGALVARKSGPNTEIRTQGMENLSHTALQPALRWAALSPNDHIRVGLEGSIPLLPADIIHGKDPALRDAARIVMDAFARRAIPAATRNDVPPKRDPLWADSTELPAFNDYWDYGVGMRVVIGGPAQNDFCAKLFERLPQESINVFMRRLQQGAALLVYDTDRPDGFNPIPTLLLAGRTAERSAELAKSMADTLASIGNYAIPPSAHLAGEPATQPQQGFALLFSGTKLVWTASDGTLLLGLAHGAEGPNPQDTQVFQYALYPFSGDWRTAALPRVAQSYSSDFVVSETSLHTGRQPNTQSFLTVDDPSLIVASLKPAGHAAAGMQSQPTHPRDGIAVHTWESEGTPWSGAIRFFVPLVSVALTDLLEEPGEPLKTTGNTFTHRIKGFGINSFWMLPSSRFPHGIRATLGPDADTHGPAHTRYWEHGTGTAPLQLQPITLLLRGDLGTSESIFEAVIANNWTDRNINGTVRLSGSTGLSIGPEEIPYYLAPGEVATHKVTVLPATNNTRTAGIVATTMLEDREYRDVYEVNRTPLSIETSRSFAQIKVSISNTSGVPAEGFLDIITPTQFWPEIPFASTPTSTNVTTVSPRRATVYVPAFRTQDILFSISDPDAPITAVAKLAANGHVLYKEFPAQNTAPDEE